MGTPGAELVSVATIGESVADGAGADGSGGSMVAASVTAGTADPVTLASTVPAIAVSSGTGGTSVGLEVERLQASPPAKSAAAAIPIRNRSPCISLMVIGLSVV